MTKSLPDATQADADAINKLAAPTRGCQAGGGVHVEIPDDWHEMIMDGEDVPGCSYASLQDVFGEDGKPTGEQTLFIDDQVQALLDKVVADDKATPEDKAKASALKGKLQPDKSLAGRLG